MVVDVTAYNLYTFGLEQDHQITPALRTLSAINRPDFMPPNSKCFPATYTNEIYFTNADSNPELIFKYNIGADSWSSQTVKQNEIVLKESEVILDHDTEVFYAFYNTKIYKMNITDTEGWTLAECWVCNSKNIPDFSPEYKPVMGFAQNHIIFINNPSLQPAQAMVFTIHYGYWQPEIQDYKGAVFPQQDGKIVNLLVPGNTVPMKFGFIPDSNEQGYLVDASQAVNATISFPPPVVKDQVSVYTASTTLIYQLTADNDIYACDISGAETAPDVNLVANWEKVVSLGGKARVFTPVKDATGKDTKSSGSSNTATDSDYTGLSTSVVVILIVGGVLLLVSCVFLVHYRKNEKTYQVKSSLPRNTPKDDGEQRVVWGKDQSDQVEPEDFKPDRDSFVVPVSFLAAAVQAPYVFEPTTENVIEDDYVVVPGETMNEHIVSEIDSLVILPKDPRRLTISGASVFNFNSSTVDENQSTDIAISTVVIEESTSFEAEIEESEHEIDHVLKMDESNCIEGVDDESTKI
jgi:hypothetical protein